MEPEEIEITDEEEPIVPINDPDMKNEVLIAYLISLADLNGYKIKAEYSTNDNDTNVIVVQETSGNKEIFFGNIEPLYNYFNIEIFGDSIEHEYKTANILGKLIGKTIYYTFMFDNESFTYEIIFKQYTNPRTIQYYDIRKVSYILTLQCVISKIN